jgi:hypothetical protein
VTAAAVLLGLLLGAQPAAKTVPAKRAPVAATAPAPAPTGSAAPTPAAAPPAAAPAAQLPLPPPPQRLPSGAKGGALRVAVVDPRATGEIPPRHLAAFSQALVPEIRKLDGVSAIGMAEIRDMLGFERQRQMLGCSADEGCLAEIGGALGVDELVTVELTLVGQSYALAGRRLDMRRARVVQSVSRRFDKRDGEELLNVVGPLIEGLWPDRALKPGATRGIDKAVVARLNPPPLPRWAFFTTAGAGAAALVGGGVMGLLAREAEKDFQAMAARSTSQAVPGADLQALEKKANDRARLANVLFLAGGGLGLAAGVEAFFTDWRDDRNALKVAPLVAPGRAGISMSGSF